MIALNYSSFVLIEFSYLNAIQESFSFKDFRCIWMLVSLFLAIYLRLKDGKTC